MAKSRDINLWDGFDGREIVYDDKKEKAYHSRIWVVLGGIAALILLSLFYQLGKEIVLRINGNKVEAEYYEDALKSYAVFYDENEEKYSVNLSQFFTPVHEGEKITLYYYEDIMEARPMSKPSAWLGYFGFFGVILGVSLWRLRAIWRPKSHVSAEEGAESKRSRWE